MAREHPDPHRPRPGSQAALDEGCTCSPSVNNWGKHPPWGMKGWLIDQECPLHNVQNPAPEGAV